MDASSNPALSVLLPAYNAEAYISKALESILRQSYHDFEVLVADDGSEDSTRKIIDRYEDSRIRRLHSDVNMGKVALCNYLLKQAEGDYITVHDADDWSDIERFGKQISLLANSPEIGMCGCGFRAYDSNNTLISNHVMPIDFDAIKQGIRSESQFHGPTMIFRKSILAEIGGFYRYFTHAEDIDFSMRVVEKYRAVNLPDLLYNYRIHPESLTNSISMIDDERFINYDLINFLADQRKKKGVDSLMSGKMKEFEEARASFSERYLNNPTLKYDRAIGRFLSLNMRSQAFRAFWVCFCKYPLKVNTYKILKNLIQQIYA